MKLLSTNSSYVAARAKSRKRKLIDSTRFRQLVQQTPEQLAVSIADSGYRQEIDKYASSFKGSDLIEVGLTHNLETELANIIDLCSGDLRKQVEIYTGRFRYHNAKVVMRASFNEIKSSEIAHTVMPEENEINVPWLKMVEEATGLRSAVEQMRRLPFGGALLALSESATLGEYEDVLDRHYFQNSLEKLSGNSPETRVLKNLLATEIDHRNIINILEAIEFGYSAEETLSVLINGGRLVKESAFNTVANSGKSGLLDVLRQSRRFDIDEFEKMLAQSETENTLDPVIIWLRKREIATMQSLSYLHPVSALPVVHYVSCKVREVENLRLIIRGASAGLSAEVLEAHIL
jgi:V/A-type H+-transporting ATPase subunit C